MIKIAKGTACSIVRHLSNANTYCRYCNTIHNKNDLYFILEDFARIITILCKNCLFQLHLQMNDIFQTESLLDGSYPNTVSDLYYNKFGIPKDVFNFIKDGAIIHAIKRWRDLQGFIDYTDGTTYARMSLLEARDQINKWKKIINKDPK